MKQRAKVRDRFSREQKAWIAKAMAAPRAFNAAGKEARDIVSRLQAKQRREAK